MIMTSHFDYILLFSSDIKADMYRMKQSVVFRDFYDGIRNTYYGGG